jgi:hypothetical protein
MTSKRLTINCGRCDFTVNICIDEGNAPLPMEGGRWKASTMLASPSSKSRGTDMVWGRAKRSSKKQSLKHTPRLKGTAYISRRREGRYAFEALERSKGSSG